MTTAIGYSRDGLVYIAHDARVTRGGGEVVPFQVPKAVRLGPWTVVCSGEVRLPVLLAARALTLAAKTLETLSAFDLCRWLRGVLESEELLQGDDRSRRELLIASGGGLLYACDPSTLAPIRVEPGRVEAIGSGASWAVGAAEALLPFDGRPAAAEPAPALDAAVRIACGRDIYSEPPVTVLRITSREQEILSCR